MRAKKSAKWTKFLPGTKSIVHLNDKSLILIKNKISIGITKSINMNWNEAIGGLQPELVKGQDGDSIIINRLKSIGKWYNPNTKQQQDAKLQKFLRNSASKGYRVNDYVMLDFPEKGSGIEKGTLLKVNFVSFFKICH